MGSIQRLQKELQQLCSHVLVAPVKRHSDGSFGLAYPQDMTPNEEHRALNRGHILARMVSCRHCGAKFEEGK